MIPLPFLMSWYLATCPTPVLEPEAATDGALCAWPVECIGPDRVLDGYWLATMLIWPQTRYRTVQGLGQSQCLLWGPSSFSTPLLCPTGQTKVLGHRERWTTMPHLAHDVKFGLCGGAAMLLGATTAPLPFSGDYESTMYRKHDAAAPISKFPAMRHKWLLMWWGEAR